MNNGVALHLTRNGKWGEAETIPERVGKAVIPGAIGKTSGGKSKTEEIGTPVIKDKKCSNGD